MMKMLSVDACEYNGFPAAPARRARRPVRPKPFNPRKTVKPTPRGKYGLPRRDLLLDPIPSPEPAAPRRQPQAPLDHNAFYRRVAAGEAHSSRSAARGRRPRLFPAGCSPEYRLSAGLAGKLNGTLLTTRKWTRLQHTFLPKYLFLLDDVAAVELLGCLVRLQPAPVAAAAAASDSPWQTSSTFTATQDGPQQQQWQQQEQQRPPREWFRLATSLSTSINSSIRHQQQTSVVSSGSSSGHAGTTEGAAVSRGFRDAADERVQFELMLSAVYSVFQGRLRQWEAGWVMKLLRRVAQLQLHHDGLLQSWFAATAPQLAAQPAHELVVMLEALALLQQTPPLPWLQRFTAASQERLEELPLQQQVLLATHVAQLQLQLPQSWWQQLTSSILRAAEQQQEQLLEQRQEQLLQEQQEQQLEQPEALQQHDRSSPPAVLSRLAADALCVFMCSASQLQQPRLKASWLSSCVALLLPALRHRRCSIGAVVQLLYGCSQGPCSKLPEAAQARGTCLTFLQLRLQRLPPAGLQLLLHSLQAVHTAQQLAPGFLECLEEALTPAITLPGQPPAMLLDAARVFSAHHHAPGLAFTSAFVVVTAAQLPRLAGADIAELISCCERMGIALPSMWLVVALQQLQEQVAASQQREQCPPLLQPGQVAAVLSDCQRVAADWQSVQAASGAAIRALSSWSSAN